MAVHGPGCSMNSTSSLPGHAVRVDALGWPCRRALYCVRERSHVPHGRGGVVVDAERVDRLPDDVEVARAARIAQSVILLVSWNRSASIAAPRNIGSGEGPVRDRVDAPHRVGRAVAWRVVRGGLVSPSTRVSRRGRANACMRVRERGSGGARQRARRRVVAARACPPAVAEVRRAPRLVERRPRVHAVA